MTTPATGDGIAMRDAVGDGHLRAPDERPGLMIVCPSLPPYRIHFHQRLVRDLPEMRLLTACTHSAAEGRWKLQPPAEINAREFGGGVRYLDSRFSVMFHEWTKAGRIIDWIRESNVAAVVVLGYNDVGRLRLLRWCRKNEVPCFLWADSNSRGNLATGSKAIVKKGIVGRLVKRVTGVMVCGRLGERYFQEYGAEPERIFRVPYEPDYEQIRSATAAQIQTTSADLGLKPDRRRIMFSGRMIRAKRPDLLLDAFLAIARERPQWDLVMTGAGPLLHSLEGRVPSEFADRVKWTGFLADQAQMSALYRACHVLALPSDYEPWALVVNEAAAAHLALVCSDVVGAAAELLRDGFNGRSFAHGDLGGLTRALLDVTRDGQLEEMRSASGLTLAAWQRAADPVVGMRRALAFAGVLNKSDEACPAAPESRLPQ